MPRKPAVRAAVAAVVAVAVAGIVAAPALAVPDPPTNLHVVTREPGRALLEWQAPAGEVQGYKIRPSDTPGVHPDPTLYPGGRSAAFSWTTDDGLVDNLLYEPSFTSRGLSFTAFVIPGKIGVPGKMTWADIDTLHAHGHEIASHTEDHVSLIDDRAFWIRATDPTTQLTIAGGTLTTTVDPGGTDLVANLTDPAVDHLVELVAWLDAQAGYEAGLLYYDGEIPATSSTFLDPVAGLAIGSAAPETLTTDRGVHDDAEMLGQIQLAQSALEAHFQAIEPGYRCRTLAYPNHAHEQWAMSTLNELGYVGVRSGNPGERPFWSEGQFELGYQTTYEVPMGFPRPSNSWDEAFTRQKYQERMAVWKANHQWMILMAHGETESDAQHVEWMVDEIASDPDIWFAPFGEVVAWLATYHTDVGNPGDGQGTVRAWIHGLDDAQSKWVVVTAYDPSRAESGWSGEVEVPPYLDPNDVPSAAYATVRPGLRAWPNPGRGPVTLASGGGLVGAMRVDLFDTAGRRVRAWVSPAPAQASTAWSSTWDGRDARGREVPSGVYFVRVRDDAGTSATVRITHLR